MFGLGAFMWRALSMKGYLKRQFCGGLFLWRSYKQITCCNLASLWIARVHREAVRSSDFRSCGFDRLTSFNPLENLTQVFCVPAAAPKISMLSVQCTFDPSKAETKKSRTPHRAVNIEIGARGATGQQKKLGLSFPEGGWGQTQVGNSSGRRS